MEPADGREDCNSLRNKGKHQVLSFDTRNIKLYTYSHKNAPAKLLNLFILLV